MALVRTLRILLALLLLSAQQTALSHQFLHFFDAAPAQNQLCDQHEALGTVVGGLDAPTTLPVGSAPAGFFHRSVALPSAATPGLAPSSRGPPAFL